MPSQFKSPLKNYFSITKGEWNGMVVLVVLIAVVWFAPYAYTWLHKDKTIDAKQFNQAIAQLQAAHALTDTDEPESNKSPTSSSVSKGRLFNKLPDSLATYHAKPFVIVELNTADSGQLTKVRGIGPAFAMRIVHYRQRLGGFYRKEQLKEVFGIDDGKYDELKDEFTVNVHKVKKIAINRVDFEGLKNNPYLNFKQANAIIMYRKEHGNYETLAEMKNVVILNGQILRKLAPYLTFK